jgi:CheY-like chemotaxis protein
VRVLRLAARQPVGSQNQHLYAIPPPAPGPDLCPMQPYALAIIEDQTPIRETLRTYLCMQPEFRCGLVAASMEEFLAGLDAPGAEPPQLILSDIGLPGRSGIEGLPLIRACSC